MSKKDKRNRRDYFQYQNDSPDGEFDEMTDEYVSATSPSDRKPVERPSQPPFGNDSNETLQNGENKKEKSVWLRNCINAVWATPGFLWNSAKWVFSRTKGFFSKSAGWVAIPFSFLLSLLKPLRKLCASLLTLLNRKKNVEGVVENAPKTAPPKAIPQTPSAFDDDETYFGGWRKLTIRTAILSASVLILSGGFFGAKYLYDTLTAPSAEIVDASQPAETNTPDSQNGNDTVKVALAEPAPAAAEPVVAARVEPEKAPKIPTEPKPLAPKPDTVIAKTEPKKAEKKIEKKELKEETPQASLDPFALSLDKTDKTEKEVKPEPPKKELTKNEPLPASSDPWGKIAANKQDPVKPIQEPVIPESVASATAVPPKENEKSVYSMPGGLQPMKKADTASGPAKVSAALPPLQAMKKEKGLDIPSDGIATNNAVIPAVASNSGKTAAKFPSPTTPPSAEAKFADNALNNIPPVKPIENIPEIIPTIPKTGNIQNFAGVTLPANIAEPRPGIPTDDSADKAVNFKSSARAANRATESNTMDFVAAPLPSKMPQGMELAKVEPSIGSQLQTGVKLLRTQGEDATNLKFDDAAKTAVKYSPQEEFVPIPMPIEVNNPENNPLVALLPGFASPSTPDSIARDLPPLSKAPVAAPATINPGYRRSVNQTAAGAEGKAKSFRQRLNESITKSPETTEQYTVQQGDTYYTISEKFFNTGLLFRALAAHNRQKFGANYVLQPGAVIEIPTAEYLTTNYSRVGNSGQYRPVKAASSAISYQTQRSYIVQEGDTVLTIATNVLRDTPRWKEILELNTDRIQDPRVALQPGLEIRLP